MSSIIDNAAKAARTGGDRGLQEVLDFLVTQEQLSVTFVSAAIERAGGTPSAAFLPVLRNAVTTEFHPVDRHGSARPTRHRSHVQGGEREDRRDRDRERSGATA